MKKIIFASLLIGLLLNLTAMGERRPVGVHGAGLRAGFTINPDQFHVGGHLDLGDLAYNLMMQPNVEIGFGDNVTTVAPSFELDYRFRSDWGAWTPYFGGGVGPVFYSTKHGNSASELGVYLQFGIGKGHAGAKSGHFFLEGKLGLADAPDFKATVGWTFGK
ncbi:MAG: hypothetical protein ABIJ61_04695 [bacterium]